MISRKLKLSKSSIGLKEKEAVCNILDLEFLGMGPEVKKFEQELEIFLNRPVVCVSSGTSALQLAIQSLGIGPGDEVIVQSLTYLASFQAISANGAIPVACDVDSETGTLCVEDAKNKISDKTKAIMPVHYAGNVGRLEEIYKLAESFGLRVIEDAAHAFGSYYQQQLVGSFGDIVCFSFDGIKNITCGEGGCVVSSDNECINFIKDARLLGVVSDTEARFARKRTWEPQVNNQGWRYHMSDIMAAIGRIQLKKIDKIRKKKNKLIKYYIKKINDIKLLDIIKYDVDNIIAHIFVVKIPNSHNRNVVRNNLLKLGIETGVHYYPNHKLEFYKNFNNKELQNTENLYEQILSLPFHNDITIEDIDYITNALSSEIK